MPVALVVHFGNTEVVLAPLWHTFTSVFLYMLLVFI